MYVGLLVEEEEVAVSKISRREKRYRSFVRSFVSNCNAVETDCQITCLDVGEPGEMYSHFVAKALWRLVPEVF